MGCLLKGQETQGDMKTTTEASGRQCFKVYFVKKYLLLGSDGKSKMSPQWLCNKCRTYHKKKKKKSRLTQKQKI